MKKLLALVCLLLSIALLSSCGGVPSIEPDDSGGDPSDDIELTLWTFPVGNWGNPTTVANLLTGFHREYPDIHISVEYLNYENGDEKVMIFDSDMEQRADIDNFLDSKITLAAL